MRDGRKKQARSNKQTRQSNTAHSRQSLFLRKMSCTCIEMYMDPSPVVFFFSSPQLSTYLFLPPLPLQGFKEDGTAPQEHTEQLVTPGSRSEMEEFEQFSSALSQYSVSLHLPTVCVHLPSKRFLEILYNRCKMVYCMRL